MAIRLGPILERSFELERNDMLPQGAALGRKSRHLWDFFRYHVELRRLVRAEEVIIGMSAASRLGLSKCGRYGAHCDVDRRCTSGPPI
jgi:hypothetical protein